MFKRKPKVNTDPEKINELLTRGVDMLYPENKWFEDALKSGKRLTIYTGWDPTTTDVHIGHTAWMWKLREFQELGHKVIVLMGTFTATLGDPTGKADARKPMTIEETKRNAKGFEIKTKAIFDHPTNPIEVKYNHDWLAKMSFADVTKLASHFTVQQMLERDMFEKRIEGGRPIGVHEFMYPLMQGYDSVAMDVDIEVGGSDQTFNMLAGRTLMKKMKNKQKGVLTRPLLADASGRKIGKSEGNAINIDLPPEDLFGKIMTLPDEAIKSCFEMCTNVPVATINEYIESFRNDPRGLKAKLAWEIVRIYNDSSAADAAEAHFTNVFKNKAVPEDIDTFKLKEGMTYVEVLVETKLCSSNSDARRQVSQGAVKLDGQLVHDSESAASVGVLQKGKRHFVRLV